MLHVWDMEGGIIRILFLVTVVTGLSTPSSITSPGEPIPQCPADGKADEVACLHLIQEQDWNSAHISCRTQGGFLLGPEHMTRPEVAQLLPGEKVTWTALGPQEGHLQWLTQRPVKAQDLQWMDEPQDGEGCACLHLDSKLFQSTSCFSVLHSVCLILPPALTPSSDADMKLQVTVDSGDTSVVEQDGWVTVTKDEFRQVSLTCTVSIGGTITSSHPHVFWKKDGVYLPVHTTTLVPANLASLSSELLQGTYWCGMWRHNLPSSETSNKVLLTLEGREVLLLYLREWLNSEIASITRGDLEAKVKEAFSDSLLDLKPIINVVSMVRRNDVIISRVQMHVPSASVTFDSLLEMLSDEGKVETLLERKGFLTSSTASFPTRCKTRTDVLPRGNSVIWPFSQVGKVQPLHYRCEDADGELLTGYCRWNYTHGAKVHFDRSECQRFDFCPPNYTGFADDFCVSRTSASTWDEGFHAAYVSEKSMSLLDAAQLIKDNKALASLYREVQEWLENEKESSQLWLPARRLAPFAPLAILSPNLASNDSSNSSEWLRIFNVSWATGQPSPEQDCLALDTRTSVLLTLPCDDAMPYLTVIYMRGLFTVPSETWRKTTPGLINKVTCPGWLGSKYPGGQGICFKVFNPSNDVGLSYNEAAVFCDERGAQLPDPTDGFLDWALRQYLFDTAGESVWMTKLAPPSESREKWKSGTFLNWKADADPSLPYPALTSSGWVREGHNATKRLVLCQKNSLVPETTIKVFEELGDIRVEVQTSHEGTVSFPQCYVNGRMTTLSPIRDTLMSDDEEYDEPELGSGNYPRFPTLKYDDADLGSGDDQGLPFLPSSVSVMKVNSTNLGYYECRAWMDSPLRFVASNVLLYKPKNIHSFSIVLSRQIQYSPKIHDAAINPEALSVNDLCLVDLRAVLGDKFLNVSTENLYLSPENQSNTLLLHLHVQFEIMRIGNTYVPEESKAYESLTTELREFPTSDCQLVSVKSTVGCYKEIQQNLTWPATQGAKVVLSAELCVTDEGYPVTLECHGNFIEGYHWGTESGECSDNLPNVTRQLWNINQVSSPSDPAVLANLTDEGHSLSAADVQYTALKMQSISRWPSVPQEDLKYIVETLNNVMEVEGEVLENLRGVLNTSNILLEAFKNINFKVKLSRDDSDQVVQIDSKLVSLARVSLVPNSSIIGYHSWRENEEEEEEEENVVRKENKEDRQGSQVSLILPDELTEQVAEDGIGWDPDHRVQILFAIYRTSKLFNDTRSFPNHTVDGHIIQGTYGGHTITDLEQPVRIYFKTRSSGKYSKCVFWDFELSEGRGGWSMDGCRSGGRHGDHVLCLCNHLTCFAHLVNFDEEGLGGVHKVILDIISIIGCVLSIISLLLVLITFLLFKKWRNQLSKQILVNLAFTILCSLVVFLAGIQQTLFPVVCRGVAVTLHYLILASFGWMLVQAVHMYIKLVKVYDFYIPRFIWKASVCAWGAPFVPIIAVLIYDHSLYDSDQGPENTICWMSITAFKYAFLPPLSITMVTNLVIFVLIIYKTTCGRVRITSTLSERQRRLTQLRMAVSVFFLLGLTWVFGLLTFWRPNLVFSYLFCITNTTQGLFIFVCQVYRDESAQKLWRNFLSVVSKNPGTVHSQPTPKTSEMSSRC